MSTSTFKPRLDEIVYDMENADHAEAAERMKAVCRELDGMRDKPVTVEAHTLSFLLSVLADYEWRKSNG